MKRKRGSTLIESLFAVFLVLSAATVVLVTMPMGTTSRAIADLNNKAMGLAQKEIEAIRSLGYANATASQLYSFALIDSTSPIATNTYSFTNADSASRDNPARILPSGTGSVKIEQIDLDLRRITVTITYSDRGNTKSVSVGTLIANI